MNSLFSDLFRKFEGVIWGVFGTGGGFGGRGSGFDGAGCFCFSTDRSTLGSMNSLFSDFSGIFEGYFRGCSGLFRGVFGRFLVANKRTHREKL